MVTLQEMIKVKNGQHKRSQDFLWGALSFLKKLTTFFTTPTLKSPRPSQKFPQNFFSSLWDAHTPVVHPLAKPMTGNIAYYITLAFFEQNCRSRTLFNEII